jgi:nucleotide-binding universal stress UspA family protein
MFERILVCLDGSKLAEQILPYAKEEALHFNSQLTLLEVVTVPTMVAWAEEVAGAPSKTGGWTEETIHSEAEKAKAYLEHLAKPLRMQGVNVECMVVQGSLIGDDIINYAQNNKIDLICIATHGHSGLGRAVFGSVADHVLRKSGLPILVIKPQVVGD